MKVVNPNTIATVELIIRLVDVVSVAVLRLIARFKRKPADEKKAG